MVGGQITGADGVIAQNSVDSETQDTSNKTQPMKMSYPYDWHFVHTSTNQFNTSPAASPPLTPEGTDEKGDDYE